MWNYRWWSVVDKVLKTLVRTDILPCTCIIVGSRNPELKFGGILMNRNVHRLLKLLNLKRR